MGPNALIFIFWMLSFKPTFSLSSFTFIKRLFSSSSLSAVRVLSIHIWGYWYFSLGISNFLIGDWNAKVGSQETPAVTGKCGLGVQNEAGQRLIEFCQENALVIANTLFQQHKKRLCTWRSPDGQHRNQIDYIFCSQSWRSSIQSEKIRPGAGCGSDHELLIAKFRYKLKKVGKTTRPLGMT